MFSTRHRRAYGGRLATLLLAALLVTSCGASDDDAPAAGSQADETPLVLYSGRSEALIGPLLKDFTAATGIAVTPRYGNSAELAATLLEEGERTPAGAFLSQDAGALGALQQQGRLASLEPGQLERVPARYRSAEGRWVGISGRARVLVYNPSLVPAAQLPRTVYDLTGPAYRGKVGYAPTNASFQSFVTGMRTVAGEERTRQFLTAFKANQPRAFEGNSQIVDAVDKGQLAMGLTNHYYLYEKADEAGGLAKVKARNHSFPGGDPGSLVNVAGVGVLAGKENDRTKALVDFLLGVPAQTYFAEQTKEFPLIEGVPAQAPGLPPLSQLGGPDIDLSELATLSETLSLLNEVGLT